MNIERMRAVQKAILAEPEHFDMEEFFKESDCGTFACIAGFAVAVERRQLVAKFNLKNFYVSGKTTSEYAIEFLELDYKESGYLFHDMGWPQQFRDRYRKAITAKERAQIAVDRIEHFIKTDGKE